MFKSSVPRWFYLALLGAGCVPVDDAPPRDAAADASPDAASPSGDVDTTSAVDGAGPSDAQPPVPGLVPRADPRATGLCDGAPADLRGAMLFADPAGIRLGAREAMSLDTSAPVRAFQPGAVPRSPVVFAAGSGPSEPAAAVAVDTPSGAELLLLDAFGATTGELSLGGVSSLQPLAGARYLAWPLQEPDRGAGRIVWVDLATGQPVHSLELDVTPTSAPMLLPRELASGGGSHWLIGTARGLLLVRDPLQGSRLGAPPADPTGIDAPEVVARWDGSPAAVQQLSAVGEWIAAVPRAGEGEPTELRLLTVRSDAGRPSLEVSSAPLNAPGPVTAHPVAWSCDRLDTWYCTRGPGGEPPDGALVLGGAGWLEVRAVPSGAVLATFDAPVRWTGLALGREGWIAGGGSHWLPGDGDGAGWTLMAVHPEAPEPFVLASGDADGCVPSPLWDVDGTLTIPLPERPGEVFRSAVPTLGGDLSGGTGGPRPLGGARNDGRLVEKARSCSGVDTRGVSSIELDTHVVRGVAAGHRSLLYHGSIHGKGALTWLEDGRDTQGLLLEGTSEVNHAVVRATHSAVFVHDDVVDAGTTWIRRVDGQTVTVWSRRIATGGAPIIGLARVGDAWVALEWGGERAVLHRFADDGTPLPGRVLDGALAARSVAVVRGLPDAHGVPPSLILGIDDGQGLSLRRLSADLEDDGSARWDAPAEGVLAGLTVDAAGHVRALFETVDAVEGDVNARWIHFDASLALVAERALPAGGAVATRADGSSLVVGPAGLMRVSADDALGLQRTVEALGPAPNLVAVTADGFVAAGEVVAGSRRTFVWAETDLLGFAACAPAGLCVAVEPAACDDPRPCVMAGCAPSTGECEVTTVPLCVSP